MAPRWRPATKYHGVDAGGVTGPRSVTAAKPFKARLASIWQMAFRRLLRGRVDQETLDLVGAELADRYDLADATIEPLEANNWLSTPSVVGDRFFVKVITDQNALVHALMTAGRNLGVFASGVEGFFERYDEPAEMATHELEATRKLRSLGVNAPEPIEAFDFDGHGVLVLEYLPDYRTLDELDPAAVADRVRDLYDALDAMHEADIVHGDLRAENVLIVDGELYFIDATKVREGAVADARAYDIACAMAVLEALVDAPTAVRPAAEVVDNDVLLAAVDFLEFVNVRPDHDFDTMAVTGEIEKIVD
jgi:hypothetical protein